MFYTKNMTTAMISISKITLACAALMAASGVFAQKAGDNIGSVGLVYINPHAEVGTLSNTAGYTSFLANTTANVSKEVTVSASWLHMYTDNIGAEFTFGIPPQVTQDLTVHGATHLGAAKIKVWTPAAVTKYFFYTPKDKVRPYLGLGISRVSFHDVSTHDDGTGLVTTLAGTSASFSSSWAPVYNVGMVYNIDEKWSINGSVSYLPIKTTATFVGSNTANVTTGDVKLNTTDYVVRLGYRF